MTWDLAVLEALARNRTDWADAFTLGLMAAGQPTATYLAALVLAVLFAIAFGAWRATGAAVLATVAATALAEYGKEFIGRPRPPAELALVATDGYAMPSSIAALTAGAAVPLVLWGLARADAIGRLVVAVLAGGVLLVGVSMVYLGAHWVSDVLAGWALGALFGVLAFRLLERLPGRRIRAAG
ncbi:phosphatase PAP2 family protein [Blastococcus sp. SYSU DS1024]